MSRFRFDLRIAAVAAAAAGLLAPPWEGALAAAASGDVSGTVVIKSRGKAKVDASNVVVYLEKVPGSTPTPPAKPHQVRQKNKDFVPEVSVVVKGTTVEFPNDDKVFHNVFSVSRAARFDLGLYKSGTTKSTVLKRPGVVDLFCNIHPDMAAKILVVDTKHYALTAKNGSFSIQGVPAGTYPVVAWHAGGDEYRGTVKVAAGQTAKLSIEVSEKRGSQKHLRKDGTPYGRYK